MPVADLFVHGRVQGTGRDQGHLVHGRVQGVDWDLSHLVMTRVCTCHANRHLKGMRAYVFPPHGLSVPVADLVVQGVYGDQIHL